MWSGKFAPVAAYSVAVVGKRGPKPHEPTAEQRLLVEQYVAVGLVHAQIAQLLGFSEDTLQRYYREELDSGVAKANAQIGAKLFSKAIAGDTGCLIFWAKTRMGWKETSVQEQVGRDGGPIQHEIAQRPQMTRDEWLATHGGAKPT